jgi:hypothetical protein
VAALVFVLLLGPETRGKTLEEIERSLLGARVWQARSRSVRHEARSGDGPAATAGPAG